MRHVLSSPGIALAMSSGPAIALAMSSPAVALALSVSSVLLYGFLVYHFSLSKFTLVSALLPPAALRNSSSTAMDAAWHPPNETWINDLAQVINGTGVYGFIFNNSHPTDIAYGQYNWCNMPHVRPTEYVVPDAEYDLEYVELVRQMSWIQMGC